MIRRNVRTSIIMRRFEKLIINQMTKLRNQNKKKRRLFSSKFIHQIWNSNDVRRRVAIDRVLNITKTQQVVVQNATLNFLNSQNDRKANEIIQNIMKFEFNIENDDETTKKVREKINYVK